MEKEIIVKVANEDRAKAFKAIKEVKATKKTEGKTKNGISFVKSLGVIVLF